MRSLQLKLLFAFLAVVLVAVAVLGLLVGRAASGAFGAYLAGRAGGDVSAMGSMMDEMMGPGTGRAMLEQMLGPAERAYLASLRGALWLAGCIAALVAIGLSLLLARQIAAPVRVLTVAARRMAAGDLQQHVPVRSGDELGELASAFNGLATALVHQEALRHQMAADIAHELRTPLAIIQANLEALLDGVRPLSTEAVADIHEETQLLARVSVERFAPQAASKDLQLTVEAEDDLPAVNIDPGRVAQVLRNLLDNALRHTPPGGVIAVYVDLGTRPDTVQMTIRDSGPGIPAEHLPNVFERFYRADHARSRTAGGSGIGLAVVRQIVEAHAGHVWVESPPGQGTTFGLVFPIARAQAMSEPPAPRHGLRREHRRQS